jgi:TP901 family phage tail tape measure protein
MARSDIKAGAAYVELYVKNSKLMKGLQDARQRLQSFGSEMQSAGRGLLGMSAAIIGPVGLATKIFADFDDAMRAVGAVTRSSESDLAMLTETAMELGRTTSFTALQVGSLMIELGRAGFNPAEINEMTASVLNLSRATGTDATLSAGIMASTLRQFGLEAGQAGRVADVLTAAANGTFNTVEALGEAMKYAGPVSASLGMSLEETAAILGTLGNVGIQGSEAGTTLRRLSIISAAELEKMEKIFGRSLQNSAGEALPLIDMLSAIGESMNGIGQTERVSMMNEAFGLLGITGATVMAGTVASTKELITTLNNAHGAASETAKQMDAGLGGSFRILASAAEGVAIAVGKSVEGAFATAANITTVLFGEITKLVGENKSLVTGIVVAASAIGAIGAALLGTGLLASFAATAIGGLIGAMSFGAAIVGGFVAIGSVLFSLPGVISMLGVALLSQMGVFQNFKNAFSTAFSGIWQTASSTFGLITTLLSDGQFAIAGQAAMIGLRIAMLQGIEGIYALFGPVGGEIIGALVSQIMGGDLQGAWTTAIVGLASVWESFANALGSIWTSITGFITKTWNSTIDGLSNKMLQWAAQGGVTNKILKMISGVDFAEEVKREQRLNSQMRTAGMNTGSDSSGEQFRVDAPSIQAATDDQSVVDSIKDAAESRAAGANAEIGALQAQLAKMASDLAAKQESAANGTPAGETTGGSTDGAAGKKGGVMGGGFAGASFVTSSAAAFAALGQGTGTANPTLAELQAIRREIREDAKMRREAERKQLKAINESGGVVLG